MVNITVEQLIEWLRLHDPKAIVGMRAVWNWNGPWTDGPVRDTKVWLKVGNSEVVMLDQNATGGKGPNPK